MGRNLEDFIKTNFKKAIDNHEIQVFYQPVIRVLSRKLCSFEALARWIDPEIGMVYPDEFIPVLEKEQAIHLLDAAILRQVCIRLRSSFTNGETPIPVSVNLSRLDFTLCDIFSVADQIVSEYHIPHEFIYFEITESVMAEELDLLKGTVDRFRAAGYQIWMDDFGSAYSSLNALKDLSFDEIKLDMRFLRPFTLQSMRIATSIIEMAKRIYIHTLMEGVETEEHFDFLRNIGCEKAQGYYFGKPMPYEGALAHLQEKGIGIELPQDRQYYDDMGTINVLSAVPFITRKEHDAIVSGRQLNSIPLALVEFFQGKIKQADEDGPFAPARLWDNLLHSGLLRLFWKDRHRRFVGASQAFLDYYGFSSLADIAGKDDEDLGWHIHADDYMNDEFRVIKEGEIVRYSPGLCMNKGENREILASKAPVYDTNGEIRGLIGYFIDRTLLNANDSRGEETARRDALTGLLNSRGILEEAAAFRDEYYRRGADFIRFHVAVNDFQSFNEQYGFDFGDKILKAVGRELELAFGHRGVVGRYMGHKFVVLLQAEGREEARSVMARIKEISKLIRTIDETPVTLYLAVGFTFFSECLDLKEQAKNSELCLHADHDYNISMETRLAHASEIFRLFDRLPVSYCVYYVTRSEDGGADSAVFYYVNRKFEEECGVPAKTFLGRNVRELYPTVEEEWIRNLKRAALNNEDVEGTVENAPNGKRYRYTASQIIYPGYCAVTYQEVQLCEIPKKL